MPKRRRSKKFSTSVSFFDLAAHLWISEILFKTFKFYDSASHNTAQQRAMRRTCTTASQLSVPIHISHTTYFNYNHYHHQFIIIINRSIIWQFPFVLIALGALNKGLRFVICTLIVIGSVSKQRIRILNTSTQWVSSPLRSCLLWRFQMPSWDDRM